MKPSVAPTDSTTGSEVTTLPTDLVTDPTETAPSQGETQPTEGEGVTTPTEAKKEEGVLLSAMTFSGDYVVLGIILYVALAAVVATAVLVTIVLIRKKKNPKE